MEKNKDKSQFFEVEMDQIGRMLDFNSDIEKLRNMPIKIDKWAYGQIGKRNDGPFKDNYQNLEVRECGEGLVDIGGFGLSREDYYFKRFSSERELLDKKLIAEEIFLRKTHAERLAKADKYFRGRGFFIHVVSGWRHPELQRIIKQKYAENFGQKKADRLFASIDRKVPAPHSTGASFDIELRHISTGKKIDMDVCYGDEKITSLYWAEELFADRKLDKCGMEAVKNRRIIYHGLCSRDAIFEKADDLFVAHPGEYWHYGDGDTLSAYLRGESFIKYGIVYPDGVTN